MKTETTSRSVRIFENEWLEKLSHVHPILPLVLWTPVICGLLMASFQAGELSFLEMGVAAFAGFLVWTLSEYLLHRYVFHLKPRNAWQERFVFIMHGNHHIVPNDPTRLVMPPAPAAILASLFYLLFYAVLGPVWVNPVFAFFLVGYLCYDYTHFAVHFFTPKTAWGRWVKEHHMRHHFIDHDGGRMGVSSPLWDYIFGTMGTQKTKK